jgi:hypothetical protein
MVKNSFSKPDHDQEVTIIEEIQIFKLLNYYKNP